MISEWAADEVAEIIHSDGFVSGVKEKWEAIVNCETRSVWSCWLSSCLAESCSFPFSHPAPPRLFSPTTIQNPRPHMKSDRNINTNDLYNCKNAYLYYLSRTCRPIAPTACKRQTINKITELASSQHISTTAIERNHSIINNNSDELLTVSKAL